MALSDVVLVAICAAVPPTLVALAGLIQAIFNGRASRRLHKRIDGRMTELLEASKGKAKAEGKLEVIEHPPPVLATGHPPAPPAPPPPGV